MGGRHTLAVCLPKVDKESEVQEMKQKQAHRAGYLQLPRAFSGVPPSPSSRPLCSLPCIFREATPGLLIKSPTLLNTGDPRLVEVDSVEQ